MSNCCARLSRVYMISTNLLFACLGIAFIAFGLIGMKDKFLGATLFPGNTFKLLAILGAVVCVAAIFGVIGAYVKKNMITYIYMIIIIGALVFQVMIGVKVYQKAANSAQYLTNLWPKSSIAYRTNLQNQFECCGFQTAMDSFVLTDHCQPTSSSTNVQPPCAPELQSYVKSTFGKLYLVIFAALALELLAMSNAITLLCSGPVADYDQEEERRKRRKSGIRLDDMSADTVGSYQQEEQKNYYAAGGGNVGNNSPNAYANHEEPNRNNRYDSYDMYRHNNNSNTYSDNYNSNTINNNRHGNGNSNGPAYY
ncbi:Tetraspanin family-domain-containing protein [Mucor mucedo]|uniref:Tetraspanin n=1 Tax=Mucor saturninus TaxID=64648 RepID=A0A8H7V9C2_9FUNG|nr:Tetraspanin family-domain-containing protein [Mucor mucedo]KAG2206004.1 hypothetical protein INT47_005322 [Mucor saturninus]KAI7889230.1 Tetraspanin family-domain-containing protein [Mucor mucedo]